MDIMLAFATLPAVVLLVYVYRCDPVEKEPFGLLITLAGLGAIAVIPAALLEVLLGNLVGNSSYLTMTQLVIENFVVIALVEESCKFAILRFKTWNEKAFDYLFDGIVYAVFVSLGFAIAENIVYTFEYGLGTAFVRAFTAIPGHAVFGVLMGYFYGHAKFASTQGDSFNSMAYLVGGWLLAVLGHGTYDLLASLNSGLSTLLFFVFLVVMVLVALSLVRKSSRKAQRLSEAAGMSATEAHYSDDSGTDGLF